MISITCPWCEGDAPFEADQLVALGGHWECAVCRTSVVLVEPAEDALPRAA